MSYFAPTDHLIVCNAGHPRPIWYDASEKSWRFLDHTVKETSDAPNNLPLGLIDPTKYVQFAVKLSPDDLVVAYTDSHFARTSMDALRDWRFAPARLDGEPVPVQFDLSQVLSKAEYDRVETFRFSQSTQF